MLIRFVHYWLSFIFLLVGAPVYALSATQTLIDKLEAINSISAEFHQELVNAKGQTIKLSHGHLYLLRPDKLLWETTQPDKSLILLNNGRLYNYDADLEQVTIQRFALDQLSQTPAGFLLSGHKKQLLANYSISFDSAKNQHDNFYKLIPKLEKDLVEVVIGFEADKIIYMHIIDSLLNKTILNFSNVHINTTIAQNKFIFNAPEHVDIIEE